MASHMCTMSFKWFTSTTSKFSSCREISGIKPHFMLKMDFKLKSEHLKKWGRDVFGYLWESSHFLCLTFTGHCNWLNRLEQISWDSKSAAKAFDQFSQKVKNFSSFALLMVPRCCQCHKPINTQTYNAAVMVQWWRNNQGSISSTCYEQLLSTTILRVHKRQSRCQSFLPFWDLRAQKLLIHRTLMKLIPKPMPCYD